MTPALLSAMKAQEGLDQLADAIRDAASEMAESGYASIVVEPEHNTVRVYWKGAVPNAVARTIAAGRQRGIVVQTLSAPYTQARLQAEIGRLVRQSANATDSSAPRAFAFTPK